MSITSKCTMSKYIADGYHNGYLYTKIWLKTTSGNVYLSWDAGSYLVEINPEVFPDDLEHKPPVWDILVEMTATGYQDHDLLCLSLFEEEDLEKTKQLDDIFKSVGLQSPWFLDFEDAAIRAQYKRV